MSELQVTSAIHNDLTGKVVRIGDHAVAGGSFADVWHGQYQGTLVAIKVIRIAFVNADKLTKRLQRERDSWARTRHGNVLSLLGYCTNFGPVPGFVSPWIEGGPASDFLVEHPDADRLKLISGLADGLSYLHTIPIVHSDIRGGNILVSSENVAYISDFGLSHYVGRDFENFGRVSASTSPHGAARWRAPEMHYPEKFGLTLADAQATPSDTWSFGMTVLELLSGKEPYHQIQPDPMVTLKILEGEIPEKPDHLTTTIPSFDELWELCGQCWYFSRDLRPSMSVVSRQIQLLWSRSVGPTEFQPSPPRSPRSPRSPHLMVPKGMGRARVNSGLSTASSSHSDASKGDPNHIIRESLLSEAASYRWQATAEDKEKDRLEENRKQAVRGGRSRAAYILKVSRGDAEARAAQLHEKAAETYYRANNLFSDSETINVEGLRVSEAIPRFESALRDTLSNGGTRLRVVVGDKSWWTITATKLAITREVQKQHIANLSVNTNPGVLIITFPAEI